MSVVLFPFSDYWWMYGLFTVLVLLMLVLDLGVFHRNPHEVSFREAATWSVIWVGMALLFNTLLYVYALWMFPRDPRLISIPSFNPAAAALEVGLEFLTGYVVEKTLSIDNIFVFVVVFSYFAIPLKFQHRVLFFGILGALAFRAVFIAAGSVLLTYHWVIITFGLFLIFTGIKMMLASEKEVEPQRNLFLRAFQRFVPIAPELHGGDFFVRLNGKLHATPLLIGLLFLELTDIVFAIDSVPAIFALTDEPLIVFTSNIFAILGLRAMYFMLSGAVGKFHLLKYGLSLVLIFVGLKMAWLNNLYGGKFPIALSLAIISLTIVTSIVLSLLFPRNDRPQN